MTQSHANSNPESHGQKCFSLPCETFMIPMQQNDNQQQNEIKEKLTLQEC